MKQKLISLVAAVWTAGLGVAFADSPVVVELYTSQGCSSCPPADKILGELADDEDVIALSFHVDYWDYIGWKDTFADPSNAGRQRAYAAARGARSIYTPQMIIGGVDDVVGNRAMQVSKAIKKHMRNDLPVEISLKRSGDRVMISAEAIKRIPNAVVQVVSVLDEAKVRISRGENAGRTITYHNIVKDWSVLESWNGRSDYQSIAKVDRDIGVVVLIQAEGNGPILGAAQLN